MVMLVLLCIAILTEIRGAPSIREATEPRLTSFSEAVEELAVATGRTIRAMRISSERCAALLVGQDVPEEVVVRLRRVVSELLDGRHASDPRCRACDETRAARLQRSCPP
jgi:hypothetical protein